MGRAKRSSSPRRSRARSQPEQTPADMPVARRWSVKRMAGAGAAVVAALAAATSLIDWTAHKLRGHDPPTIGTSIVSVERQGTATLGDYLRETNRPRRGYERDALAERGMVYALTIRLQGERGSRFPLTWFMSEADSGVRLRGASYNQEPAIFQPRNDDHTRTWPVWVPYPPHAGRYRVTFVLNNARREPVAERVTPATKMPGALE